MTGNWKVTHAGRYAGSSWLIPHSPYIPTQVHHRVTMPEQLRDLPLILPETPAESASRLHSATRHKNRKIYRAEALWCFYTHLPAGGKKASQAMSCCPYSTLLGLMFGSVHLDSRHSQLIQITKCCCAAQLLLWADLGSSELTNTPMQAASHLSLKLSRFLELTERAPALSARGGGEYIYMMFIDCRWC